MPLSAPTETDIKLMLAMIGSAESLKTDNEKLAELLGDGSSANAVRQRVQKVKALAKAVIAGETVDIKGPGGSKTPKRKAAPAGDEEGTPSKKRSSTKANGALAGAGKGRGRKAKEDDDDEDTIKTEKDLSEEPTFHDVKEELQEET